MFSDTLERMKIEIDQSGKIEDTNRDTVIAYANGQSRSIIITGKTKRRLQETYRQTGQPRLFVIKTFSVAIFLLVKSDLRKLSEIVIDEEYSGHESVIEATLKELFGDQHDPSVVFHRIGKGSKAHDLALKVFQGKIRADERLNFDKIYRYCLKI